MACVMAGFAAEPGQIRAIGARLKLSISALVVTLGITPSGMTIESDIVGERRDDETQSGM
jgi:hypothetical protein